MASLDQYINNIRLNIYILTLSPRNDVNAIALKYLARDLCRQLLLIQNFFSQLDRVIHCCYVVSFADFCDISGRPVLR